MSTAHAPWQLTLKPAFLAELLALPCPMARQVQQMVDRLRDDPRPDGHHKEELEGQGRPLYRLRIGGYRLVYTFGGGRIRLLALRPRADVEDDEDLAREQPAVAPIPVGPLASSPCQAPPGYWGEDVDPATARPLPELLTPELLGRLHVPAEYRPALASCRDADALLEAPVPPAILGRVLDALVPRPLDQVLGQPDYVLADTEDLIRFKEGGLETFPLSLDPD